MAQQYDREGLTGRARISVQETTPAKRGGSRRLAVVVSTAALGVALLTGTVLVHGRSLLSKTAPPADGATFTESARRHTIWDDRLDRRDALTARALREAGRPGVGPK
jgi:hypothetical protein